MELSFLAGGLYIKRLRLKSKKSQGNYQERSDTTGASPTGNGARNVLRHTVVAME